MRTLCAVVLLACAPDAAAPLRVGAAASLREVTERIAARCAEGEPGLRVELVFGASSELAAQLRAGAPLDVLLAADEAIPRALEAEGLVTGLRPFASNRLVVIASAEVAPRLTRPADLAGVAVRRIALPSPAVPVGHYAREWLLQRGLAQDVEARAVQTENARATLAAVEAGNADAGLVYASDARSTRSARVAFEIADAEQPRIAYLAAVAAGTRRPEAAMRFVEFLASPEAASLLRDAGFGPPGAPPRP